MSYETKSISIVIPAYNESGAISSVLKNIKLDLDGLVDEIIVVDDCSIDDTLKKAKDEDVIVIEHKKNTGYGGALKTGIKNSKGKYILMMDSDGQHSTKDVKNIILKLDNQDAIIGARESIFHSQLWRMPGKWFLHLFAQYLIGRKIKDLNSGLRIVKSDLLKQWMDLCPQGFSFSTTITMVLLSQNYTVDYVPINVNKRTGKSTVSIKTGLDTIILILRLSSLFNPLRIFLPISLIFILVGSVKIITNLLSYGPITTGSLLSFMVGLIIFSLGLLSDQISQLRLESLRKKKNILINFTSILSHGKFVLHGR